MAEWYIGLMSGTSVDSIDAALVDLSTAKPQLIATHSHPIPTDIQNKAKQLTQVQPNEIHTMAELDNQFAHLFADATWALLDKAKISAADVRAIGSHGQTIRHQPNNRYPYTIQIGDPNIIAARTGITTVADFRRRDMANGGQGAPFAPIFHAHVLTDKKENRAIVNIGGIANITLLEQATVQPLLGFDTGPGNGLMDSWTQLHLHQPYDANGQWAASGKANPALLEHLLSHPFFQLPPPKSTGRDHFNLTWLEGMRHNITSADVQATLAELTAITITNAIQQSPIPIHRILVCGGGMHNTYLIERLHKLNPDIPLNSTDNYGIAGDWLEAILFAWLAQQTLNQRPLDLTKITRAIQPSILGGIYFSSSGVAKTTS